MGQKKAEVFYSNAHWSEIGKTDDSHGTFEAAKAVCLRLLWDHGNVPCSTRGHCKKVLVTDKDGYVLFEQSHEPKFIPSYSPRSNL